MVQQVEKDNSEIYKKKELLRSGFRCDAHDKHEGEEA